MPSFSLADPPGRLVPGFPKLLVRLLTLCWILIPLVRPATAGNVEVTLVAAEHQEHPLVSHLVEFRSSPDGGLIATQWISGVRLGEQLLFPATSLKGEIPQNPGLGEVAAKPTAGSDLLDDVNDLLNEIKKKDAPKYPARPVEQIDPIYAEVTFLSDNRKVEIHRTRVSGKHLTLARSAELFPGGLRVDANKSTVAVPCYPVVIRGIVDGQLGRTTTFVPQLTCDGVDLLADCLFEHSPDMPLGHLAQAQSAASLNDWLIATKGGEREFRQLTIYLPANTTSKPYRLNGRDFTVTARGVKLLEGKKSLKERVEASGPFQLQIVLTPAEPKAEPAQVSVLSNLSAAWRTDFAETVPLRGTSLSLPLRNEANQRWVLQLAAPPQPTGDARRWHQVALLGGGTEGVRPWGRLLQTPAQSLAQSLRLMVTQSNLAGPLTTPDTFTGQLTRWGSAATEPIQITFERQDRQTYQAAIGEIPTGMYALRLDLEPASDLDLPVIVARPDVQGSLSLLTYHNRCDYLRGEEVHVQLIRRTLGPPTRVTCSLSLQRVGDGSFEPRSVGEVSIEGTSGVRGTFVTLDTAGLAPGRYQLSGSAPALVSHPLEFTVHADRLATSFDRFAWMTASFSGPVRAHGETLVDWVLGQNPSQFLSPAEQETHTAQQTLPASLRPVLAADPLYPPVEATETYDSETEREMAVGMRIGIRYCPTYGWGLNGQESAWNPKHTLPEDLDRIRRLCSLVTQRHRDFANFGGLHLNWFPTYGGYWENHPPTDGDAKRRSQRLGAELAQLGQTELPLKQAVNEDQLAKAAMLHKYRVGALARAYQAWLEGAKSLDRGLTDSGRFGQGDKYLSMLPLSWQDQHQYYPSVYFSTLPMAGVHAYTDYGFSAYQPLWGIDYWAAGRGNNPTWVTTMSNGQDIMIRHALLCAGRGADGIDIKGLDDNASRVIAQFMAAYGPMFRRLEVESDVAIVTSLRQQIGHGKLVGRWMGYTGGDYYELYKNLWYARRPPAMLLEEEITPQRLKKFKGVFLVQQKEPLPPAAMQALRDYASSGGQIFKDEHTAQDYPGTVYKLESVEAEQPWEFDKYVQTRDRMFVGVQASYDALQASLSQILAKLDPPRVETPSRETLVASLRGRQLSVAFAVNDTHTPQGIYHPWNFWSATILASESELQFDQPYVVYDLLDGGRQSQAEPNGEGRFTLPVQFDRLAGKAYVFCESPLESIRLTGAAPQADGSWQIAAAVQDTKGRTIEDAVPFEISLLDEQRQTVEHLYRALKPGETLTLRLPTSQPGATYRAIVRELVSGLIAESITTPIAETPLVGEPRQVLMPRGSEVRQFFAPQRVATDAQRRQAEPSQTFDPLKPVQLPEDDASVPPAEKRFVILLDPSQVAEQPELQQLAESFAQRLNASGRVAKVWMPDPLDHVEFSQRWRLTARDKTYLASAQQGQRILVAKPLATKLGTVGTRTNQPDYIHPESGYGEPGPRHRIFDEVILLGTPQNNRYLADLHATVGQPASANYPAPGCALVQVVLDAFCARYNALSIQGGEVSALADAVDVALAQMGNLPKQAGRAKVRAVAADTTSKADSKPDGAAKPVAVTSSQRSELPNPWRTELGVAVHPIAFTADGGLLASAGTQAANYFRFDADGQLQRKWLGKYGLRLSGQEQVGWIENWYGVPGFVNTIVRADANAVPQWLMPASRFGGSYSSWRHPGQRHLIDPASDDLFAGGQHQVMRLDPDGKVLWRYDDLPTVDDAYHFRFPRDMMLHDVSADGKRLLVAAYGIEPYARLVARFVRPTVMLFDATEGTLLWEKPGV